jgi:EAL domain-containing protein (putative c-di-GMP-specific phosphodiesterase class I)
MTQSSADASTLARGASFDLIGSELLSALDACRPQCLSLHDATGDVLWLNAGVIGPDEHGYVLDALDELALEPERTHMQRRLADNRRALFMGARDPAGKCCGVVFVVLDCPGGPEENQPMPAPLAALMRRLSMLLAPSAAKSAATARASAVAAPVVSAQAETTEVAEVTEEVTEWELVPDDPPAAKQAAAPALQAAVAVAASPRAAAVEVTELELEPYEPPAKPLTPRPAAQAAASAKSAAPAAQLKPSEPPAKPPTPKPAAQAAVTAKPAALAAELKPSEPPARPANPKAAARPKVTEKSAAVSEANAITVEANAITMIAPITTLPAAALAASAALAQNTGESLPIRARKFVRLQGRGTNRRYEITILPLGEGQDVRILKAVSAWLSHHLDQYSEEHASFAVPVSAAAALDGRFVAALGGVLTHRPLPEGMLGLLLPSAAWRHPGTAPLLAQCERLRCPVTLDDFSLRHDGFQILRSKAIRMVKLDTQITGAAMNDRFARAALAAITQSARVLGFHCIAKGDISSSDARWLAAAGVDYADPSTASAASAPAPKGAAPRALGQAS